VLKDTLTACGPYSRKCPFYVDAEGVPGLSTSRVLVKGRHGVTGRVTAWTVGAAGGEATYTVKLDQKKGQEHCTEEIRNVIRADLQEEWFDDSYLHIRHFCRRSGARAARRYIEATLSERICREGRCWHLHGDSASMAKWAVGADGSRGGAAELPPICGVRVSERAPVATVAGGGLKSMGVSTARLRCLLKGPLQGAQITNNDASSFAALASRAITWTLTSKSSSVAAVGMLHPSIRMWFALTFELQFEALQTPCTVTAGIFPGKPALLADAVPEEDRRQ
jgi:hypothetical protein